MHVNKISIHENRLLIIVFLLGICAHLLFLAFDHDRLPFEQIRQTDESQFDQEATNLLAGRGITSRETPGRPSTATYPAFVILVAAIRFIFKNDYTAVFLFQHFLVILTAYMAYFYSKRLDFGRVSGIIAACLILFYPPFLKLPDFLLPSIQTAFLVMAGVLILTFKETWKRSVLAGIIWGLVTLTRFTFQFFIPLYCLIELGCILLYKRKFWKKKLTLLLLLFISFIITLSPWYIHLYKIDNRLVSGSTGSWMMLYRFNSPNFDYSTSSWYEDTLNIRIRTLDYSAAQRDSIYRIRAFENLRLHPQAFIRNCLENIPTILLNIGKHRDPSLHSTYTGLLGMSLLTFGLLGLLRMKRKQHSKNTPVYIAFIVLYAVHVPIYGHILHGLPIWAVFAPSIGYGIYKSIQLIIDDRRV
ncbi:glycosyltransferase family 39 protein [bacterium]|nr:glycosyltransferase family 39 protein [bacterium]